MALNLLLNPVLLAPLKAPPFLTPSFPHHQLLRLHFTTNAQFIHNSNSRRNFFLPIHLALSNSSPKPPASREEAISQAKSCLSAALQKRLSGNSFSSPSTSKLKKQRQPKYRIEIPIVDDSPASVAGLASDVFSNLPISRKGSKATLLLLWPSSPALLELANKLDSFSVRNFELSSVTADALSSCDVAVFVSPEADQLEGIRRTSDGLYPKPVVLFNPQWRFEEEEELNAKLKNFVGSFDVLYSFMGLEVRGLLSKRNGVVFRCVRDGEFGGENWVVMVEEEEEGGKKKMKVVTRLKRRPAISEVEVVLYNLMAVNSPITKSAKFLRDLVSTVTGGKSKQS